MRQPLPKSRCVCALSGHELERRLSVESVATAPRVAGGSDDLRLQDPYRPAALKGKRGLKALLTATG